MELFVIELEKFLQRKDTLEVKVQELTEGNPILLVPQKSKKVVQEAQFIPIDGPLIRMGVVKLADKRFVPASQGMLRNLRHASDLIATLAHLATKRSFLFLGTSADAEGSIKTWLNCVLVVIEHLRVIAASIRPRRA